MLSPPSRMCSPTASRDRARSPPSSVTAIRVKSVVPPPTSQTRRMSPTLTFFRHWSPCAAEPGVEGGLRLLEERDLLRAPPCARGLDGQLAGHGVERGGDGQEDVLVLEPVGGGLAGDPRGSRRRAGARDRPPRPRPARPCATSSAAVQGRIGARRSTPGVREPALGRADQPARDLGPVLAREDAHARDPAATSRAGRAPRPGTPWRPAGTGTTAGAAARATSLTPTTCGIGRPGSAPGRRSWPRALSA